MWFSLRRATNSQFLRSSLAWRRKRSFRARKDDWAETEHSDYHMTIALRIARFSLRSTTNSPLSPSARRPFLSWRRKRSVRPRKDDRAETENSDYHMTIALRIARFSLRSTTNSPLSPSARRPYLSWRRKRSVRPRKDDRAETENSWQIITLLQHCESPDLVSGARQILHFHHRHRGLLYRGTGGEAFQRD